VQDFRPSYEKCAFGVYNSHSLALDRNPPRINLPSKQYKVADSLFAFSETVSQDECILILQFQAWNKRHGSESPENDKIRQKRNGIPTLQPVIWTGRLQQTCSDVLLLILRNHVKVARVSNFIIPATSSRNDQNQSLGDWIWAIQAANEQDSDTKSKDTGNERKKAKLAFSL